MQTFNIENEAFYSIFSMENDPKLNIEFLKKIIRNLQIIERII